MSRRSRALQRSMLAVAIVAGALDVRCGARSSLPLSLECDHPGSTRSCHDTCGEGTQVCEKGYWQVCAVPPATRACSNTCGDGEQQCVNDAWLPCSVPAATRACTGVCGAGMQTCTDDAWQPCVAPPPGPPTLHAVVRNFQSSNPDFTQVCCHGGLDQGIVAPTLGADGTPVYVGMPTTPTTSGAADFAQWYHDVPGVNLSTTVDLAFTSPPGQPGIYAFDAQAFFPIDGQLFGNQGAPHNYYFSLEAHGQILYGGGEQYGFASDDDLWVFINHRLAVDLGGIHAAMSVTLFLDAQAASLDIVPGQTYPLDVFYADREPPGAVLQMAFPSTDIWGCP